MSTKTIRGKNGRDVEVVVRRAFKKATQKSVQDETRMPQQWASLHAPEEGVQVQGAK